MSHEIDYPNNGVGFPLAEILRRGETGLVNESIISASGAELTCRISPREILISDQSVDYWMWAGITRIDKISFDVFTRDRTLLDNPMCVHPDFFANKFIGSAIDHLIKATDITGCLGKWYGGRRNYIEFMQNYEESGDKVKAAQTTWSGRTFTQYGFGLVSENEVFLDLEDKIKCVEATFRRS